MIYETHKITVPYEKFGLSYAGCDPEITVYRTQVRENDIDSKRLYPAVLICPGGGYDYCSPRESEPVAVRFSAYGVVSFVLNYSCVKKTFPTALAEAAAAVAFIRKNSEKYRVDPDKITVMGFSAGGHLAASLSVYWDSDFIKKPLGFTAEHKPNAAVLCYPVISSGECAHTSSIENLWGENPTPETKAAITAAASLENFVSETTPPTFIWHTSADDCVPVRNSILYIDALAKHGVPFEAAFYPCSVHGLSLADTLTSWRDNQIQPVAAGWVDRALSLIRKAGF
ncbi:MAG: alpha/beta hydrolase [Ruminococcus sp.]|nr:alpha/beta hydrolase [Ruminococcus sp.]